MVKSQILLLVFFLGFSFMKAQDTYTHLRDLTTIMTFDRSLEGIEGSPYFTEKFKKGTLKIEGKEPIQVFLRYNIVSEEMEIKTDTESGKTYKFSGNGKVEYKIDGEIYILDKISFEGKPIYGYFIEYYYADGLRLLLKPNAELIPATEARTGYEEDEPARIVLGKEYFLVFAEAKVENIRLKNRDIRKLFDSKIDKKYLRDHKIKKVGDLVGFLEFRAEIEK